MSAPACAHLFFAQSCILINIRTCENFSCAHYCADINLFLLFQFLGHFRSYLNIKMSISPLIDKINVVGFLFFC